ncbi:hypothetical protein [uncultured Selenomonas sp.]|uniref:hypothetical protein n=1 Tax=uncultured Selenomonas sp. TaxID=159275 RepID=UPI0028DB3F9B|nr:hypothetical protein [uncultured Selenomonas sp.]
MEQKRMREERLESLGLTSLCDLTPEKMDKFLHMTREMPVEEVRAVLAEIPDFLALMEASLGVFKSIGEKALAGNEESMKNFYELCNAMQECLKDELQRTDDFDKKIKIFDMLKEIIDMAYKKDTENKQLLKAVIDMAEKNDSENKQRFSSVMKAGAIGAGIFLVAVGIYGAHRAGLLELIPDNG